MNAAQGFINEEVHDPITKARYQVALLAELGSTHASVSPEGFAIANLEVGDRQPFMGSMEAAGLSAPSFQKNTALVRAQLERVQMSFESGIAVVARPEHVGEQLRVVGLEDEETKSRSRMC